MTDKDMTDKKAEDHRLPDLDWMIKARAGVQHVAHRFYKHLGSHKAQIAQDQAIRTAALQGTGACFSLWRAIFLAHTNRDWLANIDVAEKFLERLLRTNAILFGDDVNFQLWTFGYFVNNAYYRLREISQRVPNLKLDLRPNRPTPDEDARIVCAELLNALLKVAEYLDEELGAVSVKWEPSPTLF